MGDQWRVEVYEDDHGRSDVADYLNGLGWRERVQVEKKITYLSGALNAVGWDEAVRMGLLKHFGEGIWEIKLKGTRFRLLAFRIRDAQGPVLVVLATYERDIWKSRQKDSIMRRAQLRRQDWLDRHGESI